MKHEHSSPSHPAPEPWSGLPAGFADYLSLEASLSAPVTQAAFDEATSALEAEPSVIIDLGSGTGAGTIALACRFPDAQVHGIDISPELRGRLRAASATAGVADRVETHLADLDGNWSALVPEGAELVWAALSLHHVSDPAKVLRQAFEVLRPGGVLVVTELSGPATLKPDDLGSGRHGLRDRLSEALSGLGHPSTVDWSAMIDEAGFAPVRRRETALTISARTDEGARYLATQLGSHRERLAGTLTSEDLTGLDGAIEALETGSSEISSASGRAIWVAIRPARAAPTGTAAIEAGQANPTARTLDRRATKGSKKIEADVVVVGGGVAGLAAAVALSRSRRGVVVIDAGQPRNSPADGAHNVLGHEGISPPELLARGRAEAEAYGVKIIRGRATRASGSIDDFTVEVDDGVHVVGGRRIILATGLVDDLPEIPGMEQAWGHSVLHCPFCHGWEIRDQRIAILTRDEIAVHHAMMFRQLSDQVTLFLHEADTPTEEQWEQLAALDVSVVRPRVERLITDGTQVQAVEIHGGRRFEADAVVIAPRYNARTELYEALGGQAETTSSGQQVPVDPRGMTAVPGVWAAGNASQPMAMVMASAASGVTTGSAVHGDLGFADLNQAVRARRSADQPALREPA